MDAELAERALQQGVRAFEFRTVESSDAYLTALEEFRPDMILCDFSIPDFDGFHALAAAKDWDPEVPVIIYTGTVGEETAVLCLKAGADDYILKESPARLQPVVEAALRARQERKERAGAEAALKDSEERFRRLVETANDAIVSFDAGGIIQFWNPAAEVTFGYRPDEILGTSVRSLLSEVTPEGMAALWEVTSKGADSGPVSELLLIDGKRRDGTRFPMEISFSGWKKEGASLFNAIIRDTTERVLARDALESLSRQHEMLLKSAGEGIVGLEPDGTVSFANPVALSLLGMDSGELLGRDFHPLTHQREGRAESLSEADCPVLASVLDGTTFRGELVFLRKDGTAFPTATSCTPILEDGAVSGAVIIFEDITTRKDQENALRASEAKYRGLVANAVHGIYQSSADGRFLSVNPALVDILGYESQEQLLAVDMKRDLYVDPSERGRLVEANKQSRSVIGVETRWLRRDGAPVVVRLSGRSIWKDDGEFEAFEVMVEDLTEQRALEDQLRQAQKMEAVGQLTGGIAHDFNNVLSVILLNSELMALALEEGEAIDLADIHAIHDAAKRASSITRKLLGFSRRADLLMEPAYLGRVVGNLSGILRTVLPESIDLKLELSHDPGSVVVDTGSIEQMVINLVTNSRDAMPQGGRVRVEVSGKELDEEYALLHPEVEPGRYACLEVSDTGTGMDEETLKRVFDPFFTTKGVGSGTGLGMAMVYGLTKQQGGHVNVYSQVGKGTTTRIYFPLQEGNVPAAERPVRKKAQLEGSATILLVEDDEDLRAVTQRALERKGFRVLAATHGEEALELFRAHGETIDLVLSDLVLPRLGGLELLERLREENGPVRFILTSGYSGEEVSEREKADARVPFVRKPWVLTELLTAIQDTLDSEPPA